MLEENFFTTDQQQFIDRATYFCQQMGQHAVLLLVGSRGAGFADEWSDLDLWIIGDKRHLSAAQQQIYGQRRELFVDQGDWEAHWTFYDERDLRQELAQWPDEKMWIIAESRFLFGHAETLANFQKRYSRYPAEIAERKLKWLFGKYNSLIGALKMAGRDKPETAICVAGELIACLCRLCCVAEAKPFPYDKWLTDAARQTQLGVMVYPSIQRAVGGIGEMVNPPPDRGWREWTPVKELRGTRPIVQSGLKELGWRGDWIDSSWDAYYDETVMRGAP